MSAATVAMLVAIRITDNALNKVGKYPLTDEEKMILEDAGFKDQTKIDDINREIELLDFNEWIMKYQIKEKFKWSVLPEFREWFQKHL